MDYQHSIGVLLPCNVVVSRRAEGSTAQILDPRIMPVTRGLNESLPRLRCLPSSTRSHHWGGCGPPRSAIGPLTWPFTVGPAGIEPAARGLKGRSAGSFDTLGSAEMHLRPAVLRFETVDL